jgi:cell division protein FtsQ
VKRPDGFDAPSRSLLLEEPEALRATIELPPLQGAAPAEDPAPASARALRRRLRRAVRERRRAEAAEVRRFTASTRRRRRMLAGAATAVVALVGVPLALAVSPVFAVRSVVVDGGSAPVSAAVRARLGVLVGTPLALVDQGVVQRAVSAVPQVATYAVASLPPGTLQVRIVERQPVGQVRRSDGWALVDPAGVVLATTPTRIPGRTAIGVPVGDPAFPVAVAVLRALPAPLAAQVTSVTAVGPDDVRLRLTGGLRVVWGGAADGVAKGAALAAALRHVARGATVVDVSAPGLVTVR